MNPHSLQQMADACKGILLDADPETEVRNVTTDTRELVAGDLFVALVGETHDGHDYVARAMELGAVGAVVSRTNGLAFPRVVVDNTLRAYGDIGGLARDDTNATVIAITGSAGKTTTKDMTGTIAHLAGPSVVTPATENNEVGVPRLLLKLTPEHRYCVAELAMRGPGEIGYLARLCRPHIGVITNIGDAHVGRLGSREAIAQAKGELLTALQPTGVAVLNADDFFYGLYTQLAPCKVFSFGLEDARDSELHVTATDVRAQGVEPARFRLVLGGASFPVVLRVPGIHNVRNALAAAAAALAAGIDAGTIVAGLEEYEGSPMRSQVVKAPTGLTIINDAYNASPLSTPRALEILGQCTGRRVFVFGDMLELGAESEAAHREIGRLVAKRGVDWLITVGPEAAFAAQEADLAGVQANAVESVEEALELLYGTLEPEDTVLVKASRGMALERIVEGLLADG
ncbi:MAG: UDP-N-acetylmuramoyl-tripeptide--D-alanyl-D-alanine ligase [Acidobacteriota bacterium]|nr:UDP-N-acetylmuramoyl-tripeptide--D-alanyl-D-alanine ligase [Acidobacteriota bacterium]